MWTHLLSSLTIKLQLRFSSSDQIYSTQYKTLSIEITASEDPQTATIIEACKEVPLEISIFQSSNCHMDMVPACKRILSQLACPMCSLTSLINKTGMVQTPKSWTFARLIHLQAPWHRYQGVATQASAQASTLRSRPSSTPLQMGTPLMKARLSMWTASAVPSAPTTNFQVVHRVEWVERHWVKPCQTCRKLTSVGQKMERKAQTHIRLTTQEVAVIPRREKHLLKPWH